MTDHDEKDCPQIHVEFEYTVTALAFTKGAREFQQWYNKVFSRQHINAKEDFSLSVRKDGEEDILEILQRNPMFTTTSLLTLFEADRNKNLDSTLEHDHGVSDQ